MCNISVMVGLLGFFWLKEFFQWEIYVRIRKSGNTSSLEHTRQKVEGRRRGVFFVQEPKASLVFTSSLPHFFFLSFFHPRSSSSFSSLSLYLSQLHSLLLRELSHYSTERRVLHCTEACTEETNDAFFLSLSMVLYTLLFYYYHHHNHHLQFETFFF